MFRDDKIKTLSSFWTSSLGPNVEFFSTVTRLTKATHIVLVVQVLRCAPSHFSYVSVPPLKLRGLSHDCSLINNRRAVFKLINWRWNECIFTASLHASEHAPSTRMHVFTQADTLLLHVRYTHTEAHAHTHVHTHVHKFQIPSSLQFIGRVLCNGSLA